ncbi:MAG: DUF4192 domain-containing protein [Ornithinimicrobium sp.]
MSTARDLRRSTIRSLADAIVALPFQLGYYPRSSLVVICMRSAADEAASRGRTQGSVVLTARVDLAPPRDHPQLLAALEPALRRPDTDMVALIAFEGVCAHDRDATVLLRKVSQRAAAYRIGVLAQARVHDGRWLDVTQDHHVDPAQIGPGEAGDRRWQALPDEGDVTAVSDYVLAGRAPVRDRAALESLLLPADTHLAEGVRRLCDVAIPADARTEPGRHLIWDAAARTLAAVTGSEHGGLPVLSAQGLACTVDALDDVGFRDAALQVLISEPVVRGMEGTSPAADVLGSIMPGSVRVDAALCLRLMGAAAYAPAQRSAPWLSLVGYVAWHAGEGALANIAIGAALEVDPNYSLARLLDVALSAAIRPPSPV